MLEKLQSENKKLKEKIQKRNLKVFSKIPHSPLITQKSLDFHIKDVGAVFKTKQTKILIENQESNFNFEGKLALEVVKKLRQNIAKYKIIIEKCKENGEKLIDFHMLNFEVYLNEIRKNKFLGDELTTLKNNFLELKKEIIFHKKNSIFPNNMNVLQVKKHSLTIKKLIKNRK